MARNNQIFRNRRDLIKLGLGEMMCDGIELFLANLPKEQSRDNYDFIPKMVLDQFQNWKKVNCSISGYDEIAKEVKNESTLFYAKIFLRRNFFTPNLFTPKFFYAN